MVGALPVGIETKGFDDAPCWPTHLGNRRRPVSCIRPMSINPECPGNKNPETQGEARQGSRILGRWSQQCTQISCHQRDNKSPERELSYFVLGARASRVDHHTAHEQDRFKSQRQGGRMPRAQSEFWSSGPKRQIRDVNNYVEKPVTWHKERTNQRASPVFAEQQVQGAK